MAVLGNSYLDLIELHKRKDPDGNIAQVVEALHTINPVMKDANVINCNNGTTHRTTIRTGIGSATWGELYKGIPFSKSQTAQVEDVTGFIERLSNVDQRLLDISPDAAAVRLSEAQPALESISQEFEQSVFYSNVHTNGNQLHGLAPRYNAVSGVAAASQVIDGGGTGSDNTSIWFVGWGDQQCSILTPESMGAGIKREDMGLQRVLDDDGNPYFAKEEKFCQYGGLTVKDYRFVSRICNVDISDVRAGTVDLYGLMRKAYYANQARRNPKVDNGGMVAAGRMSIYCNSDILEALDALGTNAGNSDNFVRLGKGELDGAEVDTYRGFPVRETDALLNTEARVV